MDDHDIRISNQFSKIGVRSECRGGKLGIQIMIGLQTSLSMIPQQIREAPCALGLIGDNVVPAMDQFSQDAPQKMGVAVIPAGCKSMREIDDLHAAAPLREAGLTFEGRRDR